MSREIKFRAWDKIESKMWNPIVGRDGILMASNQLGGYVSFDDPQDQLMQYTGLKDKNGKEIYEGDILKVPDDYDIYGFMAGEIRQIYFKDGCFRFKPKNEGDCTERGHHLEDDGDFEVIGNIYESPELLEKDK